jgi:hypothetical protein
MATQVSLNSGAVASAGALAIQTNGTTQAVSISTGQVATLAQNPILTSGTANGVAYLDGSKVLTTGSALTYNGQQLTSSGSASAAVIGYVATTSAADGYSGIRFINTGASGREYQVAVGGSTSVIPNSWYVYDFTANAARLIIDSSGNLGLGVTPSAWTSIFKAAQVKQGSISTDSSNNTTFANNCYFDGSNWKYINTAASQQYLQYAGQHIWNTAASGTAGNTISFTQAMTLDASGNLGVGVTTVGAKLHVLGASQSAIFASTSANLNYIEFKYNSNTTYGTIGNGGILTPTGNTSDFVVRSEAELAFATGGATERARIDSSGNLLVGTTSTSGNAGFQVLPNANATGSALFSVNHITGSASGHFYASFNFNGSGIGSITQSGTTAVLFNVTSDQRLKENIVDADSASSLIDSLQVRKFDWKTDNTHQRYGFIAQELVTVAPEAVHQPANPEDMMAVDYSKLVPMLVKEIQSLRKRLAALESA